MREARERKTAIALVVSIAAVGLYPFLFISSYALGIGIAVATMAVCTVGFVLLIGYAHQLALGQAVFCMVGGYASAWLCTQAKWDPLLALLLGAALAMLLAYVIGKPILKLHGFALGMASLALQIMLISIALEVPFTGGAVGLLGVPPFSIFGFRLGSDLAFYYANWLAVFAAILIGLNIDRSRIGRSLKAIAANENAAAACGINTTTYKVQMFVISAGMASVSGSLLVHYLRLMEPGVFGFIYSLNIITAVIVGGFASIWGGFLGAGLIVAMRESLRAVGFPLWESVILGALTVVVLIAFPHGVAGFISRLYDRWLGSGDKAPPVAEQAFEFSSIAPLDAGTLDARKPLEVAAVSRSFGSLQAVADVSFSVPVGSITAMIGPNGAGKTTVFNLIAGSQPLDAGKIVLGNRNIETLLPHEIAALGIGRTFQNVQLFDSLTVVENVMCGAHRHGATGIVGISARLPTVSREEARTRATALACLRFVGLEHAAERLPQELPFGHQRLVEIARALALRPSLLLMDEPASGLNDTETERLAALILEINARGVTILLVEHDMRLVMGLADHVVVLHHGEKIAHGSPEMVRKDAGVIGAYLGQ